MPSQRSTVPRTCAECEATFFPWPTNPGRFCSVRCTGLGTARRSALDRVCEICSGTFTARPSQVAAGYARYCSQACFGRACRGKVGRECEHCGRLFSVVPAEVENGHGRFCGKPCTDAAKVVPVLERVWQQIDVRGPDECWPWMGKRHARGYGETTDRRKPKRVSRIVLAQKLGRPLGPAMFALHSCSNPPCCNPAHLFEGDHSANMVQRSAEGKYARGTRHHLTKVTEDAVRNIRRRAAAGEKANVLAREYGLSETTVGRMLHRRTWKHVT